MTPHSFTRTLLAAALLSLGVAAVPLAAQAAGAPTPSSGASTAGSTAMAQEKTGTMAHANSTLSSGDRKFIDKAAQGGMAEVELGKLASERAESSQVKQFGERMVKDHSAANDKLRQIASEKGVTPPSEMDSSTKREYDRLSKLSGPRFDREYMSHMVSDHEKDIKELKSEEKSAKDPDVKSFAQNTLPTLEEHLQLAKSADAAVKNEKNASGENPTSQKTASSEKMPSKNGSYK
jgi:putative membrane protein